MDSSKVSRYGTNRGQQVKKKSKKFPNTVNEPSPEPLFQCNGTYGPPSIDAFTFFCLKEVMCSSQVKSRPVVIGDCDGSDGG